MKQEIPKAICGAPDKPLKIGTIEIPCYVLDNRKRVLIQRAMVTALDMKRGSSGSRGGDRLAKFLQTKALKPFVSHELASVTIEPIKFKTPHGNIAYAYEATVLADICEAVLRARKEGQLHWQQDHIAERCEILLRGFARVGIIALVDEVTGYQEIRDRDELHKILEAYVAKELLPWAKRFGDDYYRELFRLRGWQYHPLSVARPILVGKLTNMLIYDRLPQGVKEEIQHKNPKSEKTGRYKYKYFQYLTTDTGIPHLDKLLAVTVAFMKVAPNWRKFMDMFNRAVPKPGTQQELDFEDD